MLPSQLLGHRHSTHVHKDNQKLLSPSVRSRPEATIACRAHVTGCKSMCEITPCHSWHHALFCMVGFTCMLTACVAAWDYMKGPDLTTIVRFIPRGHKVGPKVTISHRDLTTCINRRCKSRSRAYNRHPIRHEGSPRKGEACDQAPIALTHPALLQTAQQQPVSHLALPLHGPREFISTLWKPTAPVC